MRRKVLGAQGLHANKLTFLSPPPPTLSNSNQTKPHTHQAEQALAPVVSLNVLAGQGVHADDPIVALKVPAAHGVQAAAPPV